ncbi:MAG: undecaprenyl-diphosphatase UppP [Anaerolineae bacterium]|nr:undecaprenyl-diphosphatase UppP [Anaerolineae bacterium]MDW8098851.1 undecaprenyl-diphosphatase UppP [Anaerolineae bacterium]
MSPFQALILGILQGATEFLPISSSAHLVLVPWLLQWDPPGLLFDTMVHWGTLVAIVIFFWKDFLRLTAAVIRSLFQRSLVDPDARLGWGVIVGTIPATVLGYLFEGQFEALFLNFRAVSGFLFITALLLFLSERWGHQQRELRRMNLMDALWIGLAQALAITPGISRSGATIAAGLSRGLQREAAARFSFLLAGPAILGAGLLQVAQVVIGGEVNPDVWPVVIGFLASAITGYLCIRFLLRYLQRRRLYAFAVYCALVGLSGLVLSFLRG